VRLGAGREEPPGLVEWLYQIHDFGLSRSGVVDSDRAPGIGIQRSLGCVLTPKPFGLRISASGRSGVSTMWILDSTGHVNSGMAGTSASILQRVRGIRSVATDSYVVYDAGGTA
jgi:hypothetical protein